VEADKADAGVYLQQTWEKLPAAPEPADAKGAWMILGGDAQGFGNALQNALTGRGAAVTQVAPGNDPARALADALREAQGLRGIINLWALLAPAPADDGAAFAQAQRWTCDGTLALVQTLVGQAIR